MDQNPPSPPNPCLQILNRLLNQLGYLSSKKPPLICHYTRLYWPEVYIIFDPFNNFNFIACELFRCNYWKWYKHGIIFKVIGTTNTSWIFLWDICIIFLLTRLKYSFGDTLYLEYLFSTPRQYQVHFVYVTGNLYHLNYFLFGVNPISRPDIFISLYSVSPITFYNFFKTTDTIYCPILMHPKWTPRRFMWVW